MTTLALPWTLSTATDCNETPTDSRYIHTSHYSQIKALEDRIANIKEQIANLSNDTIPAIPNVHIGDTQYENRCRMTGAYTLFDIDPIEYCDELTTLHFLYPDVLKEASSADMLDFYTKMDSLTAMRNKCLDGIPHATYYHEQHARGLFYLYKMELCTEILKKPSFDGQYVPQQSEPWLDSERLIDDMDREITCFSESVDSLSTLITEWSLRLDQLTVECEATRALDLVSDVGEVAQNDELNLWCFLAHWSGGESFGYRKSVVSHVAVNSLCGVWEHSSAWMSVLLSLFLLCFLMTRAPYGPSRSRRHW